MQCDHRLSRAGPTLDHEDPGLGGADDLVLLGLNRGHDVAECPGAGSLQRCQQRRMAAQCRTIGLEPFVMADSQMPFTEELILQGQHAAALHNEMTPACDAHRIAPGSAVERLGNRRAPVDHDRFGILIGHGQSTDVE